MRYLTKLNDSKAKKRKDITIIPQEVIINKIFFLRNEKVMIDRDLAVLYGVKAIRLREQVKRNISKFPLHFMFQLTEQEVEILVSQNAIPSKGHLGGTLPYAFTEHGVLMLANVLKSEQAIQVSIRIIELFVKLREMLVSHTELKLEIEKIKKKIDNHDKNIEIVFSYFDELLDKKEKPRKRVGFKLPKKKK
ncbi:MAG: ORF6N domain-containing protein [Bacteroidota bacterium]